MSLPSMSHTMRGSSLQLGHPSKRARVCQGETAGAGAAKGATIGPSLLSAGMLGLRLGTASTLRGSARTTVVVEASLEPTDSGIRKLAKSAAFPISQRIQQLRNLVPGAAPPGPASPSCTPAAPTVSESDRPILPVSDHDERPAAPEPRIAPTSPSGRGAVRGHHPSQSHSGPHRSSRGSDSPNPLHQSAPDVAEEFPSQQQQLQHQHQQDSHAHGHGHSNSHSHANHQHPRQRHHHQHHHHQHHHPHSSRNRPSTSAPTSAVLLSRQHPHPRHHQRPHPQPSRDHPTLQLIASRLRTGSKPGARSDGCRLGLVVEGGGMRGCLSGAMLMGLLELGLTDVFDSVYGASAGAINATYYLSRQKHGLRIYHEDLTQGNCFLDFRNLFSGASRPVMNIDFLIDQVMNTSKPLDWDAVLSSPTPLKVVASCLDTLQPVLLSDFADRAELAQALKATAAVPQLAGPPRTVRGRTLVDAAVFEPVPLPSAIRDGCTHVLVLCTRPVTPKKTSVWGDRVRSTIEVLVKTTVLNAPYMRDAWRVADSPLDLSNPNLKEEQLMASYYGCPLEFQRSEGAYVLPLFPENTAGCHPLCRDPPTLRAACEVGRAALLRAVGPTVAEVLAEMGDEEAAAAAWDLAGGREVVTSAEAAEAAAAGATGELEGQWAGAMGGGGGGGGSIPRGPRGGFGDAELYSSDMDLRFRP